MIWNWLKKKKQFLVEPKQGDEIDQLADEIEQAKQEWLHARSQLDYAIGKEQIDYAIFALEAAEKRYEMLLKEMKNNHKQQKNSVPPANFTSHKGEI